MRKKNKAKNATVTDFKLDYKAIVTKTCDTSIKTDR